MNAPQKLAAAAALAIALPPLAEGEKWAGILFGKDGAPDHHLIKLPGEKTANWDKAMEFARMTQGGEAPTLRELALLRANLPEEFAKDWYWSSEQHADDPGYAWYQGFSYGTQTWDHKSFKLRVVAVRRVPIQQFTMGASA
jgi:hypothetical protein